VDREAVRVRPELHVVRGRQRADAEAPRLVGRALEDLERARPGIHARVDDGVPLLVDDLADRERRQ
jgi:hypothetical protein